MNEIRLLIADRETDTRTTIKTYASLEGFVCDEASDGIQALKLFRRQEYAIVILDAEIRELDAWNVCRQIRKISQIPVLILSHTNKRRIQIIFF